MATKFARSVGGNWNTDATWSTTSSAGTANTTKPTAADDVILDSGSGQITVDAASVAKTVTCTGYTNTLTHNAFALTVSGSVTFVSGMTYTPLATSTLSFAATATLTTGGKLMTNITHTSGTLTIGDNVTTMASKIITLTLSGTAVDLNGKTISGNTITSRIFFTSGTVGTGKQITVNGGTFVNADFRDITFSNATNLDLSAITGKSGDLGGNTITGGGSTLTFTAPATQTWNGNTTGSTSTAANWTSRVPLPQDNIIVNGLTSGTLAQDMPRAGTNVDFTGSTGTLTISASGNWFIMGNLTLGTGMTITAAANSITLSGRGSQTFATNGVAMKGATNVTAPGGTYTLQDNFTASTGGFTLNNGTLDFNNHDVTVAGGIFCQGTATRTLTTGSGTVTLQGTAASTLSMNQNTGLTLNFTGTKWVFSGVFSAGTLIINNNTISVTFSTISLTGSGSNGTLCSNTCTIGTLNLTAPSTVTMTSAKTVTVTNFNAIGSSGNVITVNASTPGSQATLSKTSGIVSCDWLALTDSAATGGAAWYAGANSTGATGQNNSGWIFTAPPSGFFNFM